MNLVMSTPVKDILWSSGERDEDTEHYSLLARFGLYARLGSCSRKEQARMDKGARV